MSYLLGYDLGSSSIKATLLAAETGKIVASASSPASEMMIDAPRPGWAEQNPEDWWEHLKQATAAVKAQAGAAVQEIQAIGITYQMHGLVIVDRNHQVLRPAIIWCDSRAVDIGNQAFQTLGPERCLQHLLNSPGNFTASKLKWVKEHEPEIYSRIAKMMLPGEYIAMMMTGEIKTTASGLSEGILWDFITQKPASLILDHYGIDPEFLPELAPVFGVQGELTRRAADQLGLPAGIKVAYRAGDQPNNAFSLNVLNPGEIAATAGTSGVVYGIGANPDYDPHSRVNTFVHVNHSPAAPRYGILLCLNGTAILNRWLRQLFTSHSGEPFSYRQMDQLAATVPAGAEGLLILPYGNGAERSLNNKNISASIHGIQFNRHHHAHLLRAAQEGIVFALNYGVEIMKSLKLSVHTVKAGYANMFLSSLFGEAFATVTGACVELYNTDGSQGAARGAGIGAGIYPTMAEAFSGLQAVRIIEPDPRQTAVYREAYQQWLAILTRELAR